MIIGHNLQGIYTHRVSQINQVANSQALGRLSSGLRINRAGDDAAGLTISEKMRAQIRGLNQASRNIQDGVSMVQTAEGALGTIHEMLQRGRVLAVQAANDTNTDTDRVEIQAEIDQIAVEINRVANSTEFNTKKLLNSNNLSSGSLIDTITNGLKSGWLESAANLVNTYYGLSASTRTIDVLFDPGTPGGELANITTTWSVLGNTATVAKMEMHIDLSDFNPSTGDDGENTITTGGGTMYNDRIIAHEMVHAIMADQMGDDFYDMPTWFKEGTAEFIHGADDRVEADGVANAVTKAANLIDGTDAWVSNSLNYSGAYVAVKFIQNNLLGGKSMADVFAAIQDGNDLNDNTINAIIANTTFTDIADFKAKLLANGTSIMNITPGSGEIDTGSIGGSDHGGVAKDDKAVVPNGTYSDNPTNFNFVLPSTGDLNSKTMFQLGANGGQVMFVDFGSAKAKDLGVEGIDVAKDTQMAITTFDSAIKSISTMRSRLGAIQNRLEHSYKQSKIMSENTQASETRIRDLDMAKEMMEFTKSKILMDASSITLLQSNQNQNLVLDLLR